MLAFDEATLAARLRRVISSQSQLPPPRVAPALSYGRHRGPARSSSRIAAVAVAMYRLEDGQWMLPLTIRPRHLQHHGGQICLPGGRLEAGETPWQAALREFEEELGVPANVVHDCGELTTQYVYASDNLVHPVVAIVQPPAGPWQPDPEEVQQVITLPVQQLLDREAAQDDHAIRRGVRQGETRAGDLVFRAAAIRYREHRVWGATAMILDQLAQILQQSVDS